MLGFPSPLLAMVGASGAQLLSSTPYSSYRINITAVNGDTFVSCGEWELLNTSGVNILRQGITNGTLTASSTSANSTAQLLDNDDQQNAGWASAVGFPVTLKWASAATEDFTALVMQAPSTTLNRCPSAFTIEYSDDDVTYSVAKTVASSTGWASFEVRRFTWASVGAHKYWRLNVSAADGGTSVALINFAFSRADGPAISNSGRNGFLHATSIFSTEYPNRLADGSTATGWTSGGNVPQIATVHLGVPLAVSAFKWTTRTNEGTRGINTFTVEGSNDGGATWTVCKSFSGVTGWGSLETRTFTG